MNTDVVELAPSPTPVRDLRKVGIDPNFWLPVARSAQVKQGRMTAVSFAGEPIVLVRPSEGAVFALEDRCAHRQVPLHLGVIEGDAVKCGYHGWRFNHTGKCVGVPYLEKCSLRPGNVRSYPCREAYGLIFIFPGDAERADAIAFPAIPTATDPKYKTRYLDRSIRCHFTFMHENLMDMNHQFLHRRLMGGIKTTHLETRRGDTWIEADYTFSRTRGRQPLGERLMLNQRATAEGAKDLMTIRTGYPYQTLTYRAAGSESAALELWNAYVPLDREQRTNRTFGLMMIRRPSIPWLAELFWPAIVWFTNYIFAEDRDICELEQAAFDRQGADCNHEIFPVIRGLREVLLNNSVPLDGTNRAGTPMPVPVER